MTQALQYNVKTGSYHHPKPQADYTVSSNYSGFSGVSSGDSLPGPGPQLHERWPACENRHTYMHVSKICLSLKEVQEVLDRFFWILDGVQSDGIPAKMTGGAFPWTVLKIQMKSDIIIKHRADI